MYSKSCRLGLDRCFEGVKCGIIPDVRGQRIPESGGCDGRMTEALSPQVVLVSFGFVTLEFKEVCLLLPPPDRH